MRSNEMSKPALILAALIAGGSLAAPAFAQDYRAQSYASPQGGGAYAPYNDGGLGRYCPPGQYPHSFPGGQGVRCQGLDGYFYGFGY
jgi:hypothetical protein